MVQSMLRMVISIIGDEKSDEFKISVRKQSRSISWSFRSEIFILTGSSDINEKSENEESHLSESKLINLRKPSKALAYDSQVLFAKDAVKGCCAMASIGSKETLEPEISPALPLALNFERASLESGTKLPLHYFHNLEYVLQKMQHCSLNIAEKNLRSFVICRHFDICQFIIETTASLYVNDPLTPKRFAPQKRSHHWCNTNSGHLPWNHCLTKAPRKLSSTCINEELQLVIGRPNTIETPLNSFKNGSHIFKSLLAPTVRMILYYDFTTPQVKSINQRIIGRPGDIALQTKESEPIMTAFVSTWSLCVAGASSPFCIMELIFVSGILPHFSLGH